MTLRCFLGFVFFLVTYTSGLTQAKGYQADALISVEKLQEDFHILHLTIGLGHPAWGHYSPVDSMEHWFRQTNAQIQEPMTEEAFLKLLYPLINKLGCGHTRLQHSRAFIKDQKQKDKEQVKRLYPPFKLALQKQKLFVTKVTSPDSLLLSPGAEILAIDEKKATDIIYALSNRITSDGYNQTHRQRSFDSNFDGYYRFHFGDQEKYMVDFVSPEGDTSTIQMRANAATLEERLAVTSKHRKELLKDGKELLKRSGYHLRLMEEKTQTAIMDIRSFRQRKGKKFYRDAFKYLNKNQINNLVIDLRDNGGGAVKDAGRLLSYLLHEEADLIAFKKWKKHPYEKYFRQKMIYKFLVPLILPFYFKTKKSGDSVTLSTSLKPRNKNHFNGVIYVLTNGRTFSASVLVAAYLKDQQRAKFIGQETGGGHTGTNAFLMPQLELPNSGVRLIFPLYAIQHQVTAFDIGRGLMPDYGLTYSLEDILEGRDLEMKKVRELIGN